MWSFSLQTSRKYFAIYADTCFASFGDRVKHWITLNEPLQTAINGYDSGSFAPGRHDQPSTEPYLASHHQILAHAAAVSIYRNKYKVWCKLFPVWTNHSIFSINHFQLHYSVLYFYLHWLLHSFALSKMFSNWLWYSNQSVS